MWFRTPVVAICVLSGFHNGSISRNSLPLRKEGGIYNRYCLVMERGAESTPEGMPE